MQKTRVAIAGLGEASRNIHIPAYRNLNELNLVGGYDILPETSRQKWPFPVFQDLESLFRNTRPELLVISTPTAYHYEIACEGLENGCHLLCEKPFTTTLKEANDLISRSEAMGLKIVVNNEFRFMNIYQEAKKRVGSNEFGELLFLHAHQTFYTTPETESGWRGNDPQRTCKEFGIHVLDLCRFFFDEEPELIQAAMPKPGKRKADYLNLIYLKFSAGKTAMICLDRLSRGRHRYLDLRLDGTESTIETELGGSLELRAGIRSADRTPFINLDVTPGAKALQYIGERASRIATDPLNIFANATRKLMQSFLENLSSPDLPVCSAQDNIKTLALMLAAYESSELQRPVDFFEQWKSL